MKQTMMSGREESITNTTNCIELAMINDIMCIYSLKEKKIYIAHRTISMIIDQIHHHRLFDYFMNNRTRLKSKVRYKPVAYVLN